MSWASPLMKSRRSRQNITIPFTAPRLPLPNNRFFLRDGRLKRELCHKLAYIRVRRFYRKTFLSRLHEALALALQLDHKHLLKRKALARGLGHFKLFRLVCPQERGMQGRQVIFFQYVFWYRVLRFYLLFNYFFNCTAEPERTNST